MKPGDLVRKLDEEVWRDWPGGYKHAGIPENTPGIIVDDYVGPGGGRHVDGVTPVVCVVWNSGVRQENVRTSFLEVISEAG